MDVSDWTQAGVLLIALITLIVQQRKQLGELRKSEERIENKCGPPRHR